ncbi:hypothetical protein C8R47DRAFT_1070980, partial [Mycena vitilis]
CTVSAALQTLAPQVWACANEAIDSVMRKDSALRLPFHQCLGQPNQPTAFAQVGYTFAIEESYPRQHLRDRPTGWTAFTSLGNYEANEGAVILWRERRIMRFPPGSTFFLPAGLFRYSFTGVSEGSSRMLISQTFDGEIMHYVDSGMAAPSMPRWTADTWGPDIRRRAESAIAMFPTLNQYDADTEYA